jgi:hypothetical protein
MISDHLLLLSLKEMLIKGQALVHVKKTLGFLVFLQVQPAKKVNRK